MRLKTSGYGSRATRKELNRLKSANTSGTGLPPDMISGDSGVATRNTRTPPKDPLISRRENKRMRRIAVYRDGNQMAAQIGPDWVQGIAGFGDTVADALRDLAHSFAEYRYELRGNSVGIDVAGELIEVTAAPASRHQTFC